MEIMFLRDILPSGEHSYGFRPGRAAHQAVAQAQAYFVEGNRFVVDIAMNRVKRAMTRWPALSLRTSLAVGRTSRSHA